MIKKSQIINNVSTDIAIVGLGCHYPGARNPQELWENVLGRRREFRRFLNQRLPLSDYFDPDPTVPDKVYISNAAYIDDFVFDWLARRIPKKTFEGTDIVQWLALEVAENALKDAGYTRDTIPRERTGVILGNTLTGEQSRANNMRLRWPFVKKVMLKTAHAMELNANLIKQFVSSAEAVYKSVFPEVNEDSLQGGLSNTIAGRVANYFDLHGGGYVVDGACSSSLLAICTAASQLANHELDIGLAGGVDVSLDTFELVGFAKTSALAKNDMHVYDRRGAGFIPGEGCGFVVLKRLEDAEAAGDDIYSVLRGWGVSSDGKGGITAPSSDGQAAALVRAYEKAGYSPQELDFIEGHGTGTMRGDKTELEGIAKAMEIFGGSEERICGITSFKSIVGHTKAAAGIGAFIKTVLATNRRVLPPTANCREPNLVFDSVARNLYPIIQGKKLDSEKKVRAGVSAMGFGGINSHVTIESYNAPLEKWASSIDERALLVSNQDSEIFVMSANSLTTLHELLGEYALVAEDLSLGDLTDFASHLSGLLVDENTVRAAVITNQPAELAESLRILANAIKEEHVKKDEIWVSPLQNAWIGTNINKIKVGFLLPGQGSQRLGVGRVLVERFEWARDLVELTDSISLAQIGIKISPFIFRPLDRLKDNSELEEWKQLLSDTKIAQPAICLISLIYIKFLEKLGIESECVGGHSLGELTAFYAAGAFDEESLIRLAIARGLAMKSSSDVKGSMASISASETIVKDLFKQLDEGYVTIANINSPLQTVISGEEAAVQRIRDLAKEQGIETRLLPVSDAFHSTFMAKAASELKINMSVPKGLVDLKSNLYSSINGELVDLDCNLYEYFPRQILSQVDFIKLVNSLNTEVDFLLEVGSGGVLTGLVNQVTNNKTSTCFPVASRAEVHKDLHIALANLFVSGKNIDWSWLYKQRLIRSFKAASDRIFIDNPCERELADVEIDSDFLGVEQKEFLKVESALLNIDNLDGGKLEKYLSQRGNFIADVIKSDMASMENLNESIVTVNDSDDRKNTKDSIPNRTNIQSDQTTQEILIKLVSETSGFPEEMISLQARLLDDLNLDSIKAGLLIASLARKIGIVGEIDASQYANATLMEITEAINALQKNKPLGQQDNLYSNGFSENSTDVGISLEKSLLDLITNFTGFPKESLSMQVRLLDDLNLDSIKAGQLIGDFANDLGISGQLDAARYANASLEEIIAAVNEILGQSGVSKVIVSQESDSSNHNDVEEVVLNLVASTTGFPIETLSLEVHLLDDLNLDSIKSGLLLSTIFRDVGINGEIDTAKYANASIAEIISAIHATQKEVLSVAKDSLTSEIKTPHLTEQDTVPDNAKNWVRNFIIDFIPEDLPQDYQHNLDLDSKVVLILSDNEEDKYVETLSQVLVGHGAKTIINSYENISTQDMLSNNKITHIIGILTSTPLGLGNAVAKLKNKVNRLQKIVTTAAIVESSNITFVQFGGGYFGTSGQVEPHELCCATGFARSLSLEHPGFTIRVVDLSTELHEVRAANNVVNELGGAIGFLAVGYNISNIRLIQQAKSQQPAMNTVRPHHWSGEDVIIITGGAKGITAECALALAEHTGAKIALVGSSPAPDINGSPTNEISKNLLRFQKLGVVSHYYSCNLVNQREVEKIVVQISSELGDISGVVYGAGMNKARLVEQVSVEEAIKEVSPKVLGVQYLLQALADKPPKIVVGFSSIIGITGMLGNAWYAFSNESLDLILREYNRKHTNTNVISIAYSIWQEVGMGHRMGAVDSLDKMGVGAISTDEGVKRFIQLFVSDPGEKQVIVAGALGGLQTWRSLTFQKKPEQFRFVDEVISTEPGVELTVRTSLNKEKDVYLNDHNFRGTLLFPTVFGLEAMAEVALFLTGCDRKSIVSIKQISLTRPIVVSQKHGEKIELSAISTECDAENNRMVKVGIRTEQTAYNVDHFSAVFVFSNEVKEELTSSQISTRNPLDIEPQWDLYGEYLFQGTLFQRMGEIYSITRQQVILQCEARDPISVNVNGFAGDDRVEYVLGDAFYRDVLLQSVQLPATPDIVLPINIGEIVFYGDPKYRSGKKIVTATLKEIYDKDYIWDVVVTDDSGRVSEKLIDYRVRTVNDPSRKSQPSIRDLIDSKKKAKTKSDQKVLEDTLKAIAVEHSLILPFFTVSYEPHLGRKSKQERHSIEELLVQQTMLSQRNSLGIGSDEDVEIKWLSSGKPVFHNKSFNHLNLSISHDDDYCICTVGMEKQGCDLEIVRSRSQLDWLGLLGKSRMRVFEELIQFGHSLDDSGTRLWCTVESIIKATNNVETQLSIKSVTDSVVIFEVFQENHVLDVLTVPLNLSVGHERILALVISSQVKENIKAA
jgi:acyl transferase domain-containing protein/NAD(P)-dependent dehydrogenase (short-subunit alcohol dehydrogenase family)/phosphopantetheinyl transferase/acyl carrier protein/3-hydroxymyristoyl/3-hydroxydecanoyl-(acyl carrier protein) dehydratase